MADFEIMENPEYTEQIRKFEPTDPAHADLFNSVTEKMINNEAFLKKELDKQGTGTQEQFQQQYEQLTGYTDQKIAQLIDGAPETLDTLKEVADAIAENETVVEALNEAIGKKMDKSEALSQTGDSKENTVTFTSEDNASPSSWTDVPILGSGERHSSIFSKISIMFKNIRWIYKKLGTTDISSLGGGTVTGAIGKLNTDIANTASRIPSRTSQLTNDSGFKTTDTTYGLATQTANGLMSNSDKQKLDGIASGAQKNTVTGIKGNSEGSYRTGNVNLTAANIGAAASSHTHSYLPLSGGTLTGSVNVSGGRIASKPVYDSTTTGSANLVIQSTGWMQRHSSSSRRYKHDIKDIDIDSIHKLYDLPVVTFKYKDGYIDQEDERYQKDIPGIIVEDLEKILPIAVNHENGKPEMWNNNILIPCLLKLIQDLKKEVDQLSK
ncbi:MAG: hypothetical protein HFH41_04135 [Lachnospiraceae bacterium]|nr:hypothetical protein [Lachnospiraceae bacterium]